MEYPKNIRQIGQIQGNVKVYMEDYVYTFLHNHHKEEDWKHKGAILLGSQSKDNGVKVYFIKGAVCLKDSCFVDNLPDFSDQTFEGLYQEIKKYFDGVEILGWSMDVSGSKVSLTTEIERIHKSAFPAMDSLVFLFDSIEKEEVYYIYEKNVLRRKDGYYVYYEKNKEMQDYMLRNVESAEAGKIFLSENVDEQVLRNYRAIQSRKQNASRNGLGMAVSVFCIGILVTVSALGISIFDLSGKVEKLQVSAPVGGVMVAKEDWISEATEQSVQKSGEDQSVDASVLLDEEEKNTMETGEVSDINEMEETTDQEADLTVEANEADEINRNEADTREPLEEVGEENNDLEDDDVYIIEETEYQTDDVMAETIGELTYTVQEGDSLLHISQQIYGKNRTKEICDYNEIDNGDKIYTGQTLLLPPEE